MELGGTGNSHYSIGTNSIDVILTNNTTVNFTTDNNYKIERQNGSSWEVVPLDFNVDDAAIIIAPNTSRTFTINLYPSQYSYSEGLYRVTKTGGVSTVFGLE